MSDKYVLVRSPEALIRENKVGYGWGQVDFSQFKSAEDVILAIEGGGVSPGRSRNQIKRFFNLEKGDIVLVPIYRAIVLGRVEGKKSHGTDIRQGDNRVQVNFFKDENGEPIRVPRSKLTEGLSSRLKIRMSVVPLDAFADELAKYVEQLESDNGVCFDSIFQEKYDAAIATFKKALLENLVQGSTRLKSGGYGLEELVKELLTIEGYTANIKAKNHSSDSTDVDIVATRSDPVSSNDVLIQVKHHKGTTGQNAVKQLIGVDEEENCDKWVITTGDASEEAEKLAKENNIRIMNGEDLVDWIHRRMDKLSPKFREQLGIALMPQVLD